ncbi:hypothetical protein CCUG60884_04212 [Mycobacteroides salmoniphilum]|uniref:Uncharacterized protein n=1 Tax=Mycobacteroides salmoniphilum TaxID=404941 RepID=A0A4R8SPP5_9MYCO|nr:hypothetical protein CCUG60884_04212 [Mycobacteroides salmoniphilum]
MPRLVHRLGGRPVTAGMTLFINELRDTAEVVGGTDDDADGDFDVEDIAQ